MYFTEVAPVREYVYGEEFAHVLGYTGEISPAELEEYLGLPYVAGDTVGKEGIERVYEEYVHGRSRAGLARK